MAIASASGDADRLPREHGQIRHPRADFLAVLPGQHARRLRHVPQVVHHPGGQQLTERDRPQRGVLALQRQLTFGEPPSAQRVQVPGAQARELVQQVAMRLPWLSRFCANRS
jgi:hypothetical protein